MPQVGQPFNPFKLFVGSFIPNTLLQYPNLSPSAKLIWARLAQYAGQDGRAYPKMATIANQVGLSEVYVQKRLKELVDNGFLVRQKATGQQRLQHFPDTYSFLFHACFASQLVGAGDIPEYTSGEVSEYTSNQENQLKRIKELPPLPPKGDLAGFDLFWKAYPNRKAKGDAQKAWLKLKPDADLLRTILAAIERQKESAGWTKEGGQFIPYPATWLNQQRWEDEETVAPPPQAPAIHPHDVWPEPLDVADGDLCIHGWFTTPELRAKHGDPPDRTCGACDWEALSEEEKEARR
jgi:hypothetical protein